jgi:hypothetical protein
LFPSSKVTSHGNDQPLRNEHKKLKKLNDIVGDFKTSLSLPYEVLVSIVPENLRVVSVERLKGHENTFLLSIEEPFLELLDEDQLRAVVAHELGHVWIFTHHPYLQTEQLANQVAMRLVRRETLENVYEKVWKRVGAKGDLARFLGDGKPLAPGPEESVNSREGISQEKRAN